MVYNYSKGEAAKAGLRPGFLDKKDKYAMFFGGNTRDCL
jgi:hypothetical protein